MSVFSLLLDSPVWIALILVTIALHVAFFVVLRRLFRARPPAEPQKVPPEDQGGP